MLLALRVTPGQRVIPDRRVTRDRPAIRVLPVTQDQRAIQGQRVRQALPEPHQLSLDPPVIPALPDIQALPVPRALHQLLLVQREPRAIQVQRVIRDRLALQASLLDLQDRLGLREQRVHKVTQVQPALQGLREQRVQRALLEQQGLRAQLVRLGRLGLLDIRVLREQLVPHLPSLAPQEQLVQQALLVPLAQLARQEPQEQSEQLALRVTPALLVIRALRALRALLAQRQRLLVLRVIPDPLVQLVPLEHRVFRAIPGLLVIPVQRATQDLLVRQALKVLPAQLEQQVQLVAMVNLRVSTTIRLIQIQRAATQVLGISLTTMQRKSTQPNFR